MFLSWLPLIKANRTPASQAPAFSAQALALAGFCLLQLGTSSAALAATASSVATVAPSARELTNRAIPSSTADKVKPDLLTRLKALQDMQAKEIANLDEQIRKQVQETASIDLSKESMKISNTKLSHVSSHIEELLHRRSETTARREVYERLIFAIDSKWTTQPLGNFLENECLDLAMTDLATNTSRPIWKFLTFLSVTIREIPDAREDLLNVVESYVNYSGVLEPRTPAQFLADRQYTNGSMTFTARPVPRDKVGDGIADIAQGTMKVRIKQPKQKTERVRTSQAKPATTPVQRKN